eukprot:GFKZ01004591.1.p1 GENE.GFKZ01004591.1~~GFKZ01004591.1.p1  ORF type:complete len:691 (-),score=96.48 GFKZ01004591.1:1006-2970(-)
MPSSLVVIDLISSSSSSPSSSPVPSPPPSPVPPVLKRRPFPPPIRPPTPPRPNPNRIHSRTPSPSHYSTAYLSTQPSQTQHFTPLTSPSNSPLPFSTRPSSPLKSPSDTHLRPNPQTPNQTPPDCPLHQPTADASISRYSEAPPPTNLSLGYGTTHNPDPTPMSGLQLVSQILAECTDDEDDDLTEHHTPSRPSQNLQSPPQQLSSCTIPTSLICRKVTGVGAQEEADRWRPAIVDEALLAHRCFANALHRDVSHLCASIDVYAVREMMHLIAPVLGATAVEKRGERGAPIEYRRPANATVFPQSETAFCEAVSKIVDDVIFRLYAEDEEERKRQGARSSEGGKEAVLPTRRRVECEDTDFSSPAQSSRVTTARVSGVGDSSCASSRGTPVGSWANDRAVSVKDKADGEKEPAQRPPLVSSVERSGTDVCDRAPMEEVRDSNRQGSSGENCGMEGGDETRSRKRRRSTRLQALESQGKCAEEGAEKSQQDDQPERPAKRQKRRLSDTAKSNLPESNGVATQSGEQASDSESRTISAEGRRRSDGGEGMRCRLRSATRRGAASGVAGAVGGGAHGIAKSSREKNRAVGKGERSQRAAGGMVDKQTARMEAVRRLQREARERAMSSNRGRSRGVAWKSDGNGPRRSQRNVRQARKV